jgi:hypothetical protein
MDNMDPDIPTRRRLHEYVAVALRDLASDAVHSRPYDIDEATWRERIATEIERISSHLAVGIVHSPRHGAHAVVRWLDRSGKPHTLVSVGLDRLLDHQGEPVDPAATVEELQLQHGIGIPDSPAALDGLPPGKQESP